MDFLFLDCETTGLKPDARLVQLAFKTEGGDPQNYLFKPPVKIDIGAMATHFIPNEKVENCTPFGETHRATVQSYLDRYTMVCHNVEFDKRILENEGVNVHVSICTKKVAMYLYDMESYAMQFLRFALELHLLEGGLDIKPHDAVSDILVLENLFYKIFDDMVEKMGDENKAINGMIEISKRPAFMRRFLFGKYKGETLEEVWEKEKDKTDKFGRPNNYFLWLYNEEMKKPEEERNRDLIGNLYRFLLKTSWFKNLKK